MAFSSALVLTDLNDYISPSQACIKPVEVQKKETDQQTSIKVNEAGNYYEVSMDGTEEKLESASISLNDCLACSGCITSAESVLITMQSQEELYKILKANAEAQASGRLQDIITVVISMSPQSRASIAAKYGISPMQTHQKLTHFFKNHLGAHYFFDTSFSRDFSLVESAREFVDRYRNYMENGGQQIEAARQDQEEKEQAEEGGAGKARQRRRKARGADGDSSSTPISQDMPMLASACPGWICYAEKTHGFILPHISAAKSPQQIMGSVVKDFYAQQLGLKPNQIYHISVMPCYDKKLEASRPDFFDEQYQTRDVDCVLTTIEVDKMFSEQSVEFLTLPDAPVDELFNKVGLSPSTQLPTLYGSSGSSSGGYLEYILAYAARELFGVNDLSSNIHVQTAKNVDFTEYTLKNDEGKALLRFASAYGFRNIQNVVRKVKNNKCSYHFVEVMACPGGCINGGGQLPATVTSEPTNLSAKDWITHVENIYRSVEGIRPEDNEVVRNLYREWIGDETSDRAHKLLRTQYHAVTQNLANPLATRPLSIDTELLVSYLNKKSVDMAVDMTSRYMSFNSMQDELDYWRNHAENLENTLSDTRAALDEFQISSRELEEELEKELQTTEKVCGDLKARCEQLKRESEDWKSKFTESKHEHNNAMTQMQREIDVLRATEQTFRKKTLELELDNDDLERTERAAQSSLADIEMKYNKAIERNAILEQEITTKDQLAEQVQRLKDDLNDVNHELAVLQDKQSKLEETNQDLENKLSSSERQNTDLQNKLQQQLTRSPSSRASTPDRTSGYYEPTLNRMPTHRSRIPRTSGVPGTGSPTYTGNSNPVKMVQDMVGRVRSLETRLQSCRSLVTPLLNPPPSYSSTIPISTINRKDSLATGNRSISPTYNNATGRAGSPLQLANNKYRRSSINARMSPMDTAEDRT